MINIVLMIHVSGNLICILSYSGDYFLPASRLCVGVVFISHWNIPQKIPFKVEYHANENPLTNSEKNNICRSKINITNNLKNIYNTLPC